MDGLYLVTSVADLPKGFVIEVIPVRDLNLSPKRWVNGLHYDLREGSVEIYNRGHCDRMDGARLTLENISGLTLRL